MEMKRIFNKGTEKLKRQLLRNNMTEAEVILWSALKQDGMYGYRFVRQFSIESFVLDFYCRKLRLGIEVDGSVHNIEGAREYDKEREQKLAGYHVEIIRFTNEEIKESLNVCLLRIKKKIQELNKEHFPLSFEGEAANPAKKSEDVGWFSSKKGVSMLETMLAITIMGLVFIPLSTKIPTLLKAVNDLYIKNRLVFIAEAIAEHQSRWANMRKTNLDTFWVENWETSMEWHDFEARNLDELIGVNVHLPLRYRVNMSTFDVNREDSLGFTITVYYDQDASKSLTSVDGNRVSLYTLVSQRGGE